MPDISRKKKDYKEYERKEKLKRDMELRQAQQQAQKKAYPSLKAKLVAEKLSSGSKTTDKDKNTTSKKTLPTKYDNPNKGRAINNAEKKKIANNPTFKKVAEDIKNAVVVKDSGKQPKRTAQEQAKVDKATQQKWSERYSNNKRRLDEGSRDVQNRAISGMNGTGVLYGQQESKLDKAFNPMGKFISNAMDSTINNSVPGALYTFATGNHITDNAYNNPYEEQRKQGISAMAGNMAGMALNYGLTRSAFNPMLDKATNAVMNGTRLGNAIKSSAVLGKIGQKTGELGAEVGKGLLKETLSDATIGFGQNATINYGEGLRGSDFWRQQAKDTALDFLVGGAMEGIGIGSRARQIKSIRNQNATANIGNVANKQEYLDDLLERVKGFDNNRFGGERVADNIKNASENKAEDFMDEYLKVSQMSDEQFEAYRRQTLGIPEPEPTEPENIETNLEPETKVAVDNTTERTPNLFKKNGKTIKNLREIPKKSENVGYHAGDLGKTEWHSQQAGGLRDTGHYGTGTYFVGDEKLIGKGTGYEKRPHHAVNFDDYNLYKPKDYQQGIRLHDNLARINKKSGNLDKLLSKMDASDESLSAMRKTVENAGEYSDSNLKSIQKIADDVLEPNELNEIEKQARELATPHSKTDAEYLELAREKLKDENELLKLVGLDRPEAEAEERLNEIIKNLKEADENPKTYEQYYFNILSNKLSSELNGDLSGTSKYLDDIKKSKGVVPQLAEDLGKSEADVRKAIERARDKIGKYSGSDKEDSASTLLMKELGFEGIDVRGIDGLDNTKYGSVIYDLKQNKGKSKVKPEVGERTIKPNETYSAPVEESATKQKPQKKRKETAVQQKNSEKTSKELEPKAEPKLEKLASEKNWDDFLALRDTVRTDKALKEEMLAKDVAHPEKLREYWVNNRLNSFSKNDLKEVSKEDAIRILRDAIDDNTREGWFRRYESFRKPVIETAILNDKEVRNAGLNIAYHNYLETYGADKSISFSEFVNKPIKLYRGTYGKLAHDGLEGSDVFTSFTPDRKVAEKFAGDLDSGEVVEITIKPIDTYGSYQTNGEYEYLVPKAKLSSTPETTPKKIERTKATVEERLPIEAPKQKAKEEPKPEAFKGNHNIKKNELAKRIEKSGKELPEEWQKLTQEDLLDYGRDKLSYEDAVKKIEAKNSKKTLKQQEKVAQKKVKAEAKEAKAKGKLAKKQAEAEAKAEAKKELANKFKAGSNTKRSDVIDRLKKAGKELPENVDNYSKNELIAYGRGEKTLDELTPKTSRGRKSGSSSINLKEYNDAYSNLASYKGSTESKYQQLHDDLLDKYISDKKRIGEPLTDSEINELKEMDADDLYFHIEDEQLAKEGVEDYDEWEAKHYRAANKDEGNWGRSLEDIYANTDYTTRSRGGMYNYTITTEADSSVKHGELGKAPSRAKRGKPLKKKYEATEKIANGQSLRDTSKPKEKPPQLEKADLNPSQPIRSSVVETVTPEKKTILGSVKKGLKRFEREVFDNQSEIRSMDKMAKGTKLQEKALGYTTASDRAGHLLRKGLLDRDGNELGGKAFYRIFDNKEVDLNDALEYMLRRHNIDRALQKSNTLKTKDIFGFDSDSAKAMANTLCEQFPSLKKDKTKISKWLADGMKADDAYKGFVKKYGNSFENVVDSVNGYLSKESETIAKSIADKYKAKGIDIEKDVAKEFDKSWNMFINEYAVKSGMLSKETAKKFNDLYPHYFMTLRGGIDSAKVAKSLDTPEVIRSITGSGGKFLPLTDQIGTMVNRVVRASYENELNLAIIDYVKSDPKLYKEYGKLIKTSENNISDLDDAISLVAGSVEDIKKGATKLSALRDGKRETIQISDELASCLQSLYFGKDSNIVERVGRTITNPIKQGITGKNPLWAIPNLIRDTATYNIQSEFSLGKRTTAVGRAMKGMLDYKRGVDSEYAKMYKRYIFTTGNVRDLYVQGGGLKTTGVLETEGLKGLKKRVDDVLTGLGEKGETLFRFAEFDNMYRATKNVDKSALAAREVTVDFARHGSSEAVRTLDAWVLYLNAGLQGLHKTVRTLGEHPLRTTGRLATVIGVPYTALSIMNWDNPNYWDLSDRTRQQYFCVPNIAGEKDENGNCKTFIKLPQSKEYGVLLSSSLDAITRFARGEKDWSSGFASSIKEGVLPNNPVTDNILAPLMINIATNTDYKGDKILTTSEFEALKNGGKYLDKQYDAKTSGTAMTISSIANKVMGEADIPYLKYIKSPKLVDYLIDSYAGFAGTVAQGVTSRQTNSDFLSVAKGKFVADSRYSNSTLTKAFDKYDALKIDKDNEDTTGVAHAKYNGAKAIMDAVYDSLEQEKEILADSSLSKSEKNSMVNELREARILLAKDIDSAVENAEKEYKEAPTYAVMDKDAKAKWSEDLKMDKETWAETYTKLQEASKKDEDGNGGMTAGEKRFWLLENGVKSYKQVQSFLGDNTSEKMWDEAKADYKEGKTLKDAKAEAQAEKEKEERQKNMTKEEKSFENYFKTRVTERYDGKTVKKSVIDEYISRAKYADSQNDGNGSIRQSEAKAALDSMNLTRAQKAYIWSITNDWKTNPYG